MSGRECVKIDPAILQTPSLLATTKAALTFKDRISAGSGPWGCPHSQILVFHFIESFGACQWRGLAQRHDSLDMLVKQSAAVGQGTRGNFEKSGFRFSTKAFLPSLPSSLM
jgi:hypothetical protein